MTVFQLALFLAPLTATGQPPVANPDVYTTPADENLSVDDPGILSNDTDPEGDTLTAVLVSAAGTNGVLNLSADGSFEYEPAGTGTDVFFVTANDGTQNGNAVTLTFHVTPGDSAVLYQDEGLFHADLLARGVARGQESFENDAIWGPSRQNAVPSIASQGITWRSNHAVNGIRTGTGPAQAGHYGFFSLPHGDYLAGPQCLTPGTCTDGWRGESTQTLIAIGSYVHSSNQGGKLAVILDDDPARVYELGFVAGDPFHGVVDPVGFTTFEFFELEGVSTDAFYLFADHFSFGWATPASEPRSYGCGRNPLGSLTVLSGIPQLGTTLTLGVDDPLGSANAGAIPFAYVALQAMPGFPCGVTLPRYGLNWWWEDAPSELLVSVATPDFVDLFAGPAWAGPGTPSPIALPIPNDPALVDLHAFAQGLLFDPTAPSKFYVAEAIEMVLEP